MDAQGREVGRDHEIEDGDVQEAAREDQGVDRERDAAGAGLGRAGVGLGKGKGRGEDIDHLEVEVAVDREDAITPDHRAVTAVDQTRRRRRVLIV